MTDRHYIYLGDRLADSRYSRQPCAAATRPDGKCIRGKNGNMLVRFGDEKVVVLGRRLRRVRCYDRLFQSVEKSRSLRS